ncbi:STAS domain-containing protein [Streptomyces camelliae]|uniref:Anti-sigma factor antagonist n=1 Tax=Streptomyces camelliae TaxID=3004093 RepID=A0ABY7PJC6_9ACTN|nr:STAS domain-containing protein [Streptomyces sp. HUAS 2-6]WBO68628.1 STAS domain-containing protein [Streptomyces sp. HUAS 2-6]
MVLNHPPVVTDEHRIPLPAGSRPAPGGATVVPLLGEIDVLTAPALSARLDRLTADARPDLALDLRPVTFIDCAGLGVLCRARNRVRARRGRLRLVTDDAGFQRVLRATGLRDVFDAHPRLPRPEVSAPGPEAVSTAAPRDEEVF